MQASDRDLTEKFISQGDEEAFRLLFRRHTPRLFALACRLMRGHTHDAEEVVQEAWIRAAERIGSFEWRAALSTWLCGYVINCARERRRTRARDEVADLDPDAVEFHDRAFEPLDRLALERAIAGLPDGYREVLILHDIEGYTHEEIGAALALSAGTSKSQLFHARRAMRARLCRATTAGVTDDRG